MVWRLPARYGLARPRVGRCCSIIAIPGNNAKGWRRMHSKNVMRAIAGLVMLTAPIAGVAAEDHATVRIASPTAAVMGRPSLKSEQLTVPAPETVLEVIDRDGEWY